MRLPSLGLAVGSVLLLLAACSGSDGTVPGATAPLTCGEGTHRCCGASGFECVGLSTSCTRSDSDCGGSAPPVDAGTGVDASGACAVGWKKCCPNAGCVPDGNSCPLGCAAPPVDSGGGGTDADTGAILPACWLGQTAPTCVDDTACTRAGAACNTSTGLCECPDCTASAFAGSPSCAAGLTCVSAYPGQHPTCRCEPGGACSGPPPSDLGGGQ